jgi:hypothetical protein
MAVHWMLMLMLMVVLACAIQPAVAGNTRPNILFILADDFNFAYKQDRQAIMPTMTKYLAHGGVELHNHQVGWNGKMYTQC